MKGLSKLAKHLFVPHKGNAFRPHALRHKALSLYSIGLILSQILFGVTMYSGPVIMSGDAKTIAKNIISLSNSERAKINLANIYENEALNKAAEKKLKDMFEKSYWDHSGPNGETAWEFIKESGYAYALAGENLARGFSSSPEAVKAWMESPSHRANILNENFKEIGVAVGSGEIKGNATTVIVQLFGEPKMAFASAEEPAQKNEEILGGQSKIMPEISLANATLPSKTPYFALWAFIFGLIIMDGLMIRKLKLHTSQSHIFNFRVSLLMSGLVLALLTFGVVGIA